MGDLGAQFWIGQLESARVSWLAGGGSQRGDAAMGGRTSSPELGHDDTARRYWLRGWHGRKSTRPVRGGSSPPRELGRGASIQETATTTEINGGDYLDGGTSI